MNRTLMKLVLHFRNSYELPLTKIMVAIDSASHIQFIHDRNHLFSLGEGAHCEHQIDVNSFII